MRLYQVWDSEGTSERHDTVIEDLFEAAEDDSSDSEDQKKRKSKKDRKGKKSKKAKKATSSSDASEAEDQDDDDDDESSDAEAFPPLGLMQDTSHDCAWAIHESVCFAMS